MCYDMSFFSNIKLISDYLSLDDPLTVEFEPTWHRVAQAFGPWPVIIREQATYKLKLFEWGVIADYMNTPEKIKEYRTSMANARSEKIVGDKRSAWYRIRKNRCLVFTTGFFDHPGVEILTHSWKDPPVIKSRRVGMKMPFTNKRSLIPGTAQ